MEQEIGSIRVLQIHLHVCVSQGLNWESEFSLSVHLSKSGQPDPLPGKVLPSLQWESITPSHCIVLELLLGKLFFGFTIKSPGWLHVYSSPNHFAILNPMYPLRVDQMMNLAINFSLPWAHTHTPLHSYVLNQMWMSIHQISCAM